MPVPGKFPQNAPTVSCLYLIIKNYLTAKLGLQGKLGTLLLQTKSGILLTTKRKMDIGQKISSVSGLTIPSTEYPIVPALKTWWGKGKPTIEQHDKEHERGVYHVGT